MTNIPHVDVGILTERDISFRLNGAYRSPETRREYTGEQRATLNADGRIAFGGHTYEALHFIPTDPTDAFDLRGVTIGLHFHWERREDQRFRGELHLLAAESGILVVNRIDVESYLESVISSEMSATSSPELLRAHAVISRSWLLAQIEKRQAPTNTQAAEATLAENPFTTATSSLCATVAPPTSRRPTSRTNPKPSAGSAPHPKPFATPPTRASSAKCSTATTARRQTSTAGRWSIPKRSSPT